MSSVAIGLNNNLTPEVELVGDWDKTSKLLNGQLNRAVLLGAEQGRLSAANKIKDLVKRNIRNNGPSGVYWPKYSIRYEERKIKLGGNPDKMYRLTDTYYNNIQVIRKGLNVYVGLPKNVRSKVNIKSPLTIGQIAVILERGSEALNIAARPLWAPTLKEFGGKRRIAYHIVFHIRKNILLTTGLRVKIRV